MMQWLEIQQIAKTISLNNMKDGLIWMWEAKGIYSVKSMYDVVNFGGIKHVDIHCVWKIKVHPKIHFFLWLLFHNKLLTIDNLVKRQSVDDITCVFFAMNWNPVNIFSLTVWLLPIFGKKLF
jgi:hypothetical protein